MRVLPFWQDAHNEGVLPNYQRDCATCMKNLTKQQRQRIACGFLPPMPGVRAGWTPKAMIDEWAKTPGAPEPLTVCAGYTTSLPEVRETAECYPQWEAKYLTEYLGETPRPDLLACLAVLKRAANDRDRSLLPKPKDGG